MPPRYPPIEPYDHGLLGVGDGQEIYWETCGNPDGKPAVVLHGGPGSGCTPGSRRYFDPARYRIVLLDQRQCGRSRPHASDPATDLSVNTTDHLVDDIEQLREHLGMDRWLVFGGSWGCVLALVYAERHPDRVTELVLLALATGRRAETDLLTRGLGPMFPAAHERFRAGVPEGERDGDLTVPYNRLLGDADPEIRDTAARNWTDWEEAILPTSPGPFERFQEPAYRQTFARLVTHFWSHGSWLEEGAVLRDAGRLAAIPGVLVQGTLDLGNLIGTPWQLAAAYPGSELIMIDEAGHGSSDDETVAALVTATDRFAAE